MKAVQVRDRRPVLVDVARPVGPGVLVDVAAVGICGTDLHLLGLVPPGITLGHEIAGRTPDGTPVAVEPSVPCLDCASCRAGETNLCGHAGPFLGSGADGGMAEQVLVDPRQLVVLPAGLDPRHASLVEPLAVSVHGLRRARAARPVRVGVVGGGTIGLTTAAVAAHAGAEVTVAARHPHQRDAVERLGCTAVDELDRGHHDLVFEAAGTASALEQAVRAARAGGEVVIVGFYWEPLTIDLSVACRREVTLTPAILYGRVGVSRDIEAAAALLGGQPSLAEVLITHRFPLDAAVEAFDAAADRSSGSIKVTIEVGG